MKKILLLFFLFFCSLSFLDAQVYERRGSGLYFELMGNGVFYSINYESRFSNQNRGLGGTVGVGFLSSEGKAGISAPIMINYLLGKPEKRHLLEIGAGVTYFNLEGIEVSVDDEDILLTGKIYGTLSIMYHNHPRFGGFMWKIGFTPLIGSFEDHGSFLGWVGFGAGYAF